MPQMAPNNWLFLFIMFSMIFSLFNMLNYYPIHPKTPESSFTKKMKTNSLNWKW